MATDLGMTFSSQVDVEFASVSDEPDDFVAGPTSRGSAKSGYSLWTFDGASWLLTKDRSAPGYLVSATPSVPGRFKGQVRAILSVPVA